jgi:hypothetical protein
VTVGDHFCKGSLVAWHTSSLQSGCCHVSSSMYWVSVTVASDSHSALVATGTFEERTSYFA